MTGMRLITEASRAGADFVKFQRFRADTMVAQNHPDWSTFKKYEIPDEWITEFVVYGKVLHTPVFFSVFHPDDVEAVMRFAPDVVALKIASAELTYPDLLTAVAATGKPVILSTGMATDDDLDEVDKWRNTIHWNTALLHCVSAYPAPPEEVDLTLFRYYRQRGFLGLSDHTADPYAAPLMAAALGASIIEKHFRLDNSTGPDAPFSIKPDDFKRLATSLHVAHLMLGDGVKRVMASEQASLSDRRTLQGGRWLRGMPTS